MHLRQRIEVKAVEHISATEMVIVPSHSDDPLTRRGVCHFLFQPANEFCPVGHVFQRKSQQLHPVSDEMGVAVDPSRNDGLSTQIYSLHPVTAKLKLYLVRTPDGQSALVPRNEGFRDRSI